MKKREMVEIVYRLLYDSYCSGKIHDLSEIVDDFNIIFPANSASPDIVVRFLPHILSLSDDVVSDRIDVQCEHVSGVSVDVSNIISDDPIEVHDAIMNFWCRFRK